MSFAKAVPELDARVLFKLFSCMAVIVCNLNYFLPICSSFITTNILQYNNAVTKSLK